LYESSDFRWTRIKVQARLAIDQPDTGFEVIGYEIGGDGRSLCPTSDTMRARYRECPWHHALMRTSEPLLYEFERFTFISRLIVGPADSNHLHRNFNSCGDVAQESISNAWRVRVRLFHDPEHPSAFTC
jgi:uncharacterized protein